MFRFARPLESFLVRRGFSSDGCASAGSASGSGTQSCLFYRTCFLTKYCLDYEIVGADPHRVCADDGQPGVQRRLQPS
jgi:hypothetical protein